MPDRQPRRPVPYFSQWETPAMTLAVVAEGAERALLRDPAWRGSGAATIEDYARWAGHLCGMACLRMVLAARGASPLPSMMELARGATAAGGYVEQPDGVIRGLIYAPLLPFMAEAFGIAGEIRLDLAAADLPALLADKDFFIASVHKDIRWPERHPDSRGGHLVLVTAATPEEIIFHNPSGHDPAAQADARLSPADFDRFFAGRGIAIARG
ncbi:hypothetical protein BKE38_28115 [Pseudoroseomonas deserti]|uniref:Peptidase C39-like domain-containing protein n=2 Tax=Teichococcus deserti TaxID=1817963 RepID=A0A1V2GUJ6_9PROT|nr:hypothetical protein BKE38_28115 [Pseudoroseomonas deserti]